MHPALEAFLLAAAACVGATVGSFLNVCIYRFPREGLSITHPSRSFCPACARQLPWYDNVPILSWIVLGGRCRGCRSPVSLRYLLVEALTATLFVIVAHRYIVELEAHWGACLAVLFLVSGLIVATFVDIDVRLIPDEVTISGMHLLPFFALLFPDLHVLAADGALAGLLASIQDRLVGWTGALPGALREGPTLVALVASVALVGFGAGYYVYAFYRRRRLPKESRGFRDLSLAGVLAGSCAGVLTLQLLRAELTLSPPVYSFWATMAGMFTGSGVVFLVGVVGTKVFRKPAMGFGDVKLMGLLGGFAGYWGVLAGFFLACLLGSLVGVARWCISRDRYLPFGPFLAVGCLVPILWPGALQNLLTWYLSLFAVRGG